MQGDKHHSLYSTALTASSVNWIAGNDKLPEGSFKCTAKFRYRQPDQGVTLTPQADGTIIVEFDKPQKAITPGQAVVFYNGEECLGGGTIEAPVKLPEAISAI
ncbi:tRNA-specific 2-thiouridylase MnmA [compost metagenome]